MDTNLVNDSFYRGLAVKLALDNQDTWNVVDLSFIDTKDDKNMNVKFFHEKTVKAFFIPVTEIKNFIPTKTKQVKRSFDLESGLENWEAL